MLLSLLKLISYSLPVCFLSFLFLFVCLTPSYPGIPTGSTISGLLLTDGSVAAALKFALSLQGSNITDSAIGDLCNVCCLWLDERVHTLLLPFLFLLHCHCHLFIYFAIVVCHS
jgi:hypothetical protein